MLARFGEKIERNKNTNLCNFKFKVDDEYPLE